MTRAHTLMKCLGGLALAWAFCQPAQALDLHPVPTRPAPALSVPLATGGQVDLARLRGRVVLVNYWASWCPPCLMEMPSMDRLARIMARRRFTLLAVNVGESADWVKGMVTKMQPGFPIGLDEGSRYMHAWGAMVMPTSYLVDKAGRIRFTLVGPAEWDNPEVITIINRLMAE